jgi:GTP-binding protein HflX
MISNAKKQETAILVSVATQKQTPAQTKEYLRELEFLAATLGIKTLHIFTQRLERPDHRTFVGKGKLEDIKTYVLDNPVDIIIFDDDLIPSQVRNLEKEFTDVKVIDRSLLILDIFAMRAQTAQSRTQVELAQYQYVYPRLTRMWSHLSSQKGGVGMRGPGEKELETDRRIVQDRIAFLKEKLEKIDKQSMTQRKERNRLVRVSLVGYTNVGKSTLMRRLAKVDVFAENKLFATVDSTVRKMVLDGVPFLLTDTVGFIRKLPTMLVESFKSTLDEVREADILLHVIDISHNSFEEQIAVVNQTLTEIKAADKPTILVFNKIDVYVPAENAFDEVAKNETGEEIIVKPTKESTLETLKKGYLAKNNENNADLEVVFISAEQKENIAELRDLMLAMVKKKHFEIYPNWLDVTNFEFQEEEV